MERREYPDVFPEFNYRIGKAFQYGIGVRRDDMVALRHYLLARFSIEGSGLFDVDNSPMFKDVATEIKLLARKNRIQSSQTTFDSDTFYDSFVELSDEYVRGVLSDASYDEKEKVLHFKLFFETPQILTDTAALSVGYIQGETSWEFLGISSFRMLNSHFTHVRFEGDDAIRFYEESGEGFDLVAEAIFLGEAKNVVIKTKPSKRGSGK